MTYAVGDLRDIFARAPLSLLAGQRSPAGQTPRISGMASRLRAANQGFLLPVRRFPRPSLLASRSRYLRSREGLIGEPLADDADSGAKESGAIVQLAGVEPERLFVQVAEEVEGLDADVSPLDRPLQERPEVLQSVGVDLPANVALAVVDDLMVVRVAEVGIGLERVGEDLGTFGDLLPHFRAQSLPANVGDDLHADLAVSVRAVALQKPHDGGFASSAGSGDLGFAAALVHEA